MLDLFLAAFVLGWLAIGLRRPFLWVLVYLYVDIVAPQKISYFLLASLPISLIAFLAAAIGWMMEPYCRAFSSGFRIARPPRQPWPRTL